MRILLHAATTTTVVRFTALLKPFKLSEMEERKFVPTAASSGLLSLPDEVVNTLSTCFCEKEKGIAAAAAGERNMGGVGHAPKSPKTILMDTSLSRFMSVFGCDKFRAHRC